MDERDIIFYHADMDRDAVKRKNELLRKFNYECKDKRERVEVIRQLFGHVGKNPSVTPLLYCDLGSMISIGDDFYSNYNLVILDCAKVTIGDNAFIGPNVGIYAVGHAIDPEYRRNNVEFGIPITIGNDVWIGGHAVVNPGVTIGNNVVIGSGAVVTHDVPDNVIVAGNPARVIRSITPDDKKYFAKINGVQREYPQDYIERVMGKK
ncbi:MAG: sugar O-acetyltransferase [Clostridiales bacterium]|nr:sugar O-acetyltransferase [Clostridiales bacterium]